jgi:hypothetical protein
VATIRYRHYAHISLGNFSENMGSIIRIFENNLFSLKFLGKLIHGYKRDQDEGETGSVHSS